MFTLSHLPARSRAGLLFAPLALLLAWLLLASPAHAKRVALVIGNDSYQHVERLKNAVNDAKLMASTLRQAGFEVSEHQNLDRNRLYDVVDGFQKRLGKGDEVVFYFSGHGVQLDNDPMLLPVDIQANDDKKLRREGLPLLYVQDALKDARVSLLVIDACRDNPFPKQGTRTIGETRGLRPPDVVKGQAVILSAGRNQKALDSVPGEPTQRNGLFTHEFARVIATPGLDVRSALNTIRDQVEDKAAKVNHAQRPSLIDDLRGQFVLVASVGVVPTGQPVQTQADPEQEAWELAKRRDSVAAYEGFLASFPNGRLAASARSALAGLQPTAVSQPAQPSQPVQQVQATQGSNVAQPGQAFEDCQHAHCPEMVVIPAGSFTMGANDGEADEQPTRRVNIRSFAMGKYEVTQGQWKAVMGSNPSSFSNCGDNCPVEQVSWNDIQQYIQKLNQMTGQQYRLPSEAEWEYAARAGSTGKWSFGNDESQLGQYAWYGANSNRRTQRVGQKQANAFGLYDMHGNVWEWVQDCFEDNYSKGQPTDGSAHKGNDGNCSRRVLRGGSWSYGPVYLRSASRIRLAPDFRLSYIGFRIARTVP